MLPTLPTTLAPANVPSTRAWLLLFSLLAALLVASHQTRPAAALAGRPAAPALFSSAPPAARPAAAVAWAVRAAW